MKFNLMGEFMNKKRQNQESKLEEFRGIVLPGYYIHKNLGLVEITSACAYMQALNPDNTSVFIEHDGEIKEVTKSMLKKVNPLKKETEWNY
jgi:hypothetical protein